MIYTHIAYAPVECEKNLGCAYNKFMDILPNDDDWGCFLDHDAMFTTSDWYNQLTEIIECNDDVGIFGCRTNRIARAFHLVGNIDVYNQDISYHRKIGKHIQHNWYKDVFLLEKDLTHEYGFSGVCILIKKKVWKQIGGFEPNGFLAVDDDIRKKADKHKIKIGIMNGVYVYHWYRADNPYKTSKQILSKIQRMWFKKNQKKSFDLNKIFLFGNHLREHIRKK